MKVNPVNVKINDLIDEHNKKKLFTECKGCDICRKIHKISKENGLWIKSSESLREASARARNLKKEDIERHLNAGCNQKEIAGILNVSEQVIGRRIKAWFPNYKNLKKIEISLDDYESLLGEGMTQKQIAKHLQTNVYSLQYYVKKLRKAKKANA